MSLISDIDNALYGGLNDFAKQKPYNAAFIGSIPIVGDYARMHEQHRYLSDYVNGRGLSWKDVQYPFSTASANLPEFSDTLGGIFRHYTGKRFRRYSRKTRRRMGRTKPYRRTPRRRYKR